MTTTRARERVATSARRGDRSVVALAALGLAIAIVVGAAWFGASRQIEPQPIVPQSASVSGVLPSTIEGWSGQQLVNAAIIIQAGRDMGMSERDQQIAVMTAMGESSLLILDRGDTAGPDSRGLFQQRDGWGPYDVRMDAYASAQLFYRALARIQDREALAPTIAAHRVQINRNPLHYERSFDDAVAVWHAIAASDATVTLGG